MAKIKQKSVKNSKKPADLTATPKATPEKNQKSQKKTWIIIGIIAALLVIIGIVAAVILINKNSNNDENPAETTATAPEWSEAYYAYLQDFLAKNRETAGDNFDKDAITFDISFHDVPDLDEPAMFIDYDFGNYQSTSVLIQDNSVEGGVTNLDTVANSYVVYLYDISAENYAYYMMTDYMAGDESLVSITPLADFIAKYKAGSSDLPEGKTYPDQASFEKEYIEADTGEASFKMSLSMSDEDLKKNVSKTAKELKTSEEIVKYVSESIQQKLEKALAAANEPEEATAASEGFVLHGTTFPYGKYQQYGPEGEPTAGVYMVLNADGTGYTTYSDGSQHQITHKIGQANMTQSDTENWMTALIVTDLDYGYDHGYVAGTNCQYCLADTGLGYYKYIGN